MNIKQVIEKFGGDNDKIYIVAIKRNSVTVSLGVITAIALIVGLHSFMTTPKYADAENVICSIFRSQSEAQDVFETDRERFKKLDRDGDGKACESLK